MSLSKEEILEAISGMSVMDIVDLISAMEEKFGVSAATQETVAATTRETEEVTEDEGGTGDLQLLEVGGKKVEVIKAIRSITGLGLKDSKALVDGAPLVIKEGISKAEAEEYAKQLEEAGATSEFK